MAIYSYIILLAVLFGSLIFCCMSISFSAHTVYAYNSFDIIFHTRISYIWDKGNSHKVQVRIPA